MLDREAMKFDVVIVGTGPAGLSAAICPKQFAFDATGCVVHKDGEIGAHILSGCVPEPRTLDELLRNWREPARSWQRTFAEVSSAARRFTRQLDAGGAKAGLPFED